MRLVVAHYHWRPGGVRQVVENGVPALVARRELGIKEVVFVAGEAAPVAWAQRMREAIGNVGEGSAEWGAGVSPAGSHRAGGTSAPPSPASCRVTFLTEPAFGYVSEWSDPFDELRGQINEATHRLLANSAAQETVVLLENPAVGRNLLLAPAWQAGCAQTSARLICHHHDFFFDGRWERWPEIARCGYATLEEALAAAVPRDSRVLHRCVSPHDTAWLHAWLREEPHPADSLLWPNPVTPLVPESPAALRPEAVAAATAWWRHTLRTDAPVWVLPARLLRRKNVLEGLLLARLLAPEAVVATTGGPSSAAERPYAEALSQAAARHGWPLRLAVMAGGVAGGPRDTLSAPPLSALLAASACVVASSLFEGFGLAAHEAAAIGRPCLVRAAATGGYPPPPGAQAYEDILIRREGVDWQRERTRQQRRWQQLSARLPWSGPEPRLAPTWWDDETPLPFSRLTLEAQLEVLAQGTCAPVGTEILFSHAPDPQPRAAALFSPHHFAERAAATIHHAATSRSTPEATLASTIVRDRLVHRRNYPLLWI